MADRTRNVRTWRLVAIVGLLAVISLAAWPLPFWRFVIVTGGAYLLFEACTTPVERWGRRG